MLPLIINISTLLSKGFCLPYQSNRKKKNIIRNNNIFNEQSKQRGNFYNLLDTLNY